MSHGVDPRSMSVDGHTPQHCSVLSSAFHGGLFVHR
jgi:hypothetical protein